MYESRALAYIVSYCCVTNHPKVNGMKQSLSTTSARGPGVSDLF